MARSPVRVIGKTARILAVRRAVEALGRASKQDIDAKVGDILGDRSPEISRRIYEDLNELEALGEISAEEFHKSGERIDIEQGNRPYRKEWSWSGGTAVFLGAGTVRSLGGEVLCSSRLRDTLKCRLFLEPPEANEITFIFNIGTTRLCLSLPKENAPITLLVGRLPIIGNRITLSDAERRFGRRTCVLMLPIASVSASRSELKPGHFAISVDTSGGEIALSITNLNPRSGIDTLELKGTQLFADAFDYSTQEADKTLSRSSDWLQSIVPIEASKKSVSDSEHGKSPPILVRASKDFGMLVVSQDT